MAKLSIIGAGSVGTQTAFYAAIKKLADEIVLVDIIGDLACGRARDLSESLPLLGPNIKIAGSSDYAASQNSDLVVITAGLPRKPGMSREELLAANSQILKSLIPLVVHYSPQSILIIVTNPLDTMAQLAYHLSGFPKNRVLGMAGVLDTARFKAFLARELRLSPRRIEALVLGAHGDLMVPLTSLAKVGKNPLNQRLSQEKIKGIVEKTKKAGGEIIQLLKNSSTCYAPAAAIIEMAESILKDQKKILPCSVLLEGEYGTQSLFIGVPVRLGKNGAEEIIELPLSEEEKQAFHQSAEHLRQMVENLLGDTN